MSDLSSSQQGQILDPDVSEEEHAGEIDNTVPTVGYNKLRVVGVGGSAGSIPALQRFFSAMPADSGMAFVVVLHLAPDFESSLAPVLQRTTPMSVRMVDNGDEVKPNEVYVIPPGKQLSMTDGHLRLTELVRGPGRHMTVDLFLRSLADTHGPRAVAIVLSGGDGDGSIGVKRIKERGGLTIAQDPEASEHSSMPRAAIATHMVDWVLRVEDMPARLLDYHEREQRLKLPEEDGPNPAEARAVNESDDEETLREVLSFLHARTGRDFSCYKRATIVRRIARRLQVNELEDVASYLTFLQSHPGEPGALLQDLLISVTNFFRDREAFDALAARIPALFHNKSQTDTVRVWVPACATGEEAYSIAMLLSEHARTLEAPPALQVFATDLDEEVLLEARNGLFPNAINADVSVDRLRSFFVKERHGYRVRRELREILLFAMHDVLKDSPFSRLDLVSCRNLLIYLNRSAQQQVLDTFHFALRPGGFLFLGTSESVEDGSRLFSTVDKKHRLYSPQSVERGSLLVPAVQGALARALSLLDRGTFDNAEAHGAQVPSDAASGPRIPQVPQRFSWSELHLKLIQAFGPPSLIVSAQHDILHLSPSASPFLQFSGGEPSMNLMRAVHPALRVEVRATLFRARQLGKPALASAVAIELDGKPCSVEVRVSPATELGSEFFLVSFELQATPSATARASDGAEPLLRDLEREIEQTKRYLRDLVEQHEVSTEELKASNEELQAMNEELRSATEELETSREELQSINEELTTVNHELKGKVEELGQANSDLHNLMGATEIATIFLDRELTITRFTPPAVSVFSLIGSDVGRPLGDLQHRLDYPELLSDAASVLQLLVPIQREIAGDGGRFFLARLLPYRTTDDRIAGVVLTFVDVTERQLAQQAVRLAKVDFERRVQERTSELDGLNLALKRELQERERAERSRQELQRQLIEAQEAERSRISRELHDEVGQQIVALMLSMKALENAPSQQEMLEKLGELRATAEKVGREIHELAFELRPLALDELGLTRALSGLLESWQARTDLSVDFVSAGIEETRLPAPIETTIYRIVQEAMTNICKHAAAGSVSVVVERRGDFVTAIVEDDGAGFDLEALETNADTRHIGIAGMRERAGIVGGHLTMESTPGHGTTVRVRIPVPPPHVVPSTPLR